MSEEATTSPKPQKEEAVNEVPSQPLLAFGLANWGGVIDVVSKSILIIVGFAYMIGLLILNFHIRKYGLHYLGFLQVEYVMVGLLWSFLVAVTYGFGFYFLHQIKNAYRESQTWRWKLLTRTLNIIFWTAAAFTLLYYILAVASEDTLNLREGLIYKILLTLLINTVALFNISKEAKIAAQQLMAEGDRDARIYKRARYFVTSYQLMFFLVALYMYSANVFPVLSPVFGGGKKQKAEFIIKAEHLETLNTLGLQVNNRSVGPLEVIFEGTEFFAVSPPEGLARDKVKAIRIRKDMVDATLYLSEKNF